MIRLFHVSDIHFGAEDVEALDWFKRVVRNEVPDAIIVTGDLTMRARHREFAAAAEWLESLDRPTTVEVGNHDLPYFNPWARFVTPYKRYRALESMIERPLEVSGVSIVPLKTTARFQWRLNWSKGHVSTSALQESLALVEAAPEGDRIFIACHHPLVEADTRMSSETRRGEAALDALARAGAEAVLTGHVHDPFDVEHQVAGRPMRLIGAGTLSERLRDHPPSFNEIRVRDSGFETLARVMDEAHPQAKGLVEPVAG
ncbi:metallophosphoesterase family protein [Stakelama tenebrarum]|uniref:Metallophosphoesterase n=1 Tax=Stakelama tenebrarum TaxID=2711215 RepID=A0A6G6Y3T1_9SPHN|nr:metallophosphoesterase [Sphingosinithalassobacter tenebrarum]QIG79604.1 metallophosphoesterase [Sphingosinithalassobacter tenebrarum]